MEGKTDVLDESAIRKLRTQSRNALSVSEDSRFVYAARKVEFELLHLNLALAQPDYPLHIHELSYVALGRV